MSTENSFKFVEEANLLDKVQVGTISDAVLSFLIAPNSINFQEQLAEISTEHKYVLYYYFNFISSCSYYIFACCF